jgi:hypothetical protein
MIPFCSRFDSALFTPKRFAIATYGYFSRSLMIILAMTALLIGALLGLRFKVFILVPAIAIGSAAILSVDMAHSEGIWPTLLATISAITALQMGYLRVGFESHEARAMRRTRSMTEAA